MGDIADYIEAAVGFVDSAEDSPEDAPPGFWYDVRGESHALTAMGDRHLANAIPYASPAKAREIVAEQHRRADGRGITAPEGVWRDRAGREYAIASMGDDHLANALRFAAPGKANEMRAEMARRAESRP